MRVYRKDRVYVLCWQQTQTDGNKCCCCCCCWRHAGDEDDATVAEAVVGSVAPDLLLVDGWEDEISLYDQSSAVGECNMRWFDCRLCYLCRWGCCPVMTLNRVITSHHNTSYHSTSQHSTLHHITSYHITFHHVISHHSTSHHIPALYQIPSHHISSQYITSQLITSYHKTAGHVTSQNITSRHITTHYITSHPIKFHQITHITSHNTSNSPDFESVFLPCALW